MPPRTITDTDTVERAQKAVREFRKMQFGLTSYARSVTGSRNIRVEVSTSTPYTDGKVIYYRPPIALGDKTPHDRFNCDKRDDDGLHLCSACKVREEVLVNIYHEIAHIAFGSFETGVNYKKHASEINPYLPFLWNALEDSRVDLAMFNARRGTRKMFMADQINLLKQAKFKLDEVEHNTSTSPLNVQIALAAYLEVVKVKGWQESFHSKIVEDLQDEQVQVLLDKVRNTTSVEETYTASKDILNRLRELGYFLTEDEKKEQDEEQGQEASGQDSSKQSADNEADQEQEAQGDSDVSSASSAEQDQVNGSDQDSVSDEPESSDDEGDDSTDSTEQSDSNATRSDTTDSSDAEQADSTDESSCGGSDESPQGGVLGEGDSESSGSSQDESESEDGSVHDEQGLAQGSSDSVGEENEGSGSNQSKDLSQERPEPELSPADESSDDSADGGSAAEGNRPDDSEVNATDLEYGTPEQVEQTLDIIHPHEEDSNNLHGNEKDKKTVGIVVIQGMYFETPSGTVSEVREYQYHPENPGWYLPIALEDSREELGVECDMNISEKVLGPALLLTRRIFSDNQTSSNQVNLRSGRVNQKVLGRRAWNKDDRLFSKKRIPGKKDYAVLIGIDISSSNKGNNLALVKRSAYAQAELCARVGIDFSIVAHSAKGRYSAESQLLSYVMNLHHVKSWSDSWDDTAKQKLSELSYFGGNLDGHAMEYMRKQLNKVSATDKILLYFTDGAMPAANAEEELVVLQNQIKLSRRDGIVLLGVGIRTDSPIKHGLDTIRVDDDSDFKAVVDHLGRRLLSSAR